MESDVHDEKGEPEEKWKRFQDAGGSIFVSDWGNVFDLSTMRTVRPPFDPSGPSFVYNVPGSVLLVEVKIADAVATEFLGKTAGERIVFRDGNAQNASAANLEIRRRR